MRNCKNCGGNEFKDGKCSYCGTDYGLTGDKIQDEWLITNKRIATMKEDGWELVKQSNATYSVLGIRKDKDFIMAGSSDVRRAVEDLWEDYCYTKYKPEIKEERI